MRKTFLFLFLFVITIQAIAQIKNPNTDWSFSSKKISDCEFELTAKVTLTNKHHIYSVKLTVPDQVPEPTTFTFTSSNDYKTIGEIKESSNKVIKYDSTAEQVLAEFENYASFTQRVKILKPNVEVNGKVHFMTCDDRMCVPPMDEKFSYSLSGKVCTDATTSIDTAKKIIDTSTSLKIISDTTKKNTAAVVEGTSPCDGTDSYWSVFIAGVLAGLVSLVMPCVWPVIPLTVSFFLKQSKTKKQGRTNAIIYGLSITLIFVLLGILVSLFAGEQKLNELSSHWFFNLLFFAIFFLFALSFFGMFEIRLPSSLVNKSEQMSDKGGLVGIFFMAFTLVLVSFSCTLPFIGGLLKLVTDCNQFMKPIIGFAAYGLTLGLPFALFAYFPSMLQNLPKSGGWMTTLKVFFGFLELALCFIYLSKVDLAYHWNFLSRDLFIAIWVIIFAALGLYLLGKIKLPHDDDTKTIGVPRMLVALASLAFALYMIPGMWGAPLKGLSGFLPNYSEFKITGGAPEKNSGHKYADLFEAPNIPGLDLYFDYDEAFKAAQEKHKPLFLDFTGHACVNCRYNEQNVWPDASVAKRLVDSFVCASLYVDDKKDLEDKEQYYSEGNKKQVETIGDRNADLQINKFKLPFAQPYYVLIGNDGKILTESLGGKCKPAEFTEFLDKGLAAFRKK